MANRPVGTAKRMSMARRGWAAWIASITIVIIAWAPLLGTLHQALVRHVVCEHGDLIELSPAPAAATHASESAGPAVGAGDGRATHGHDHCSVGTLAKNVATVITSSSLGALLTLDRPVSLAARDANPVRSVLSNAPKTSPPAGEPSRQL
jgi:hypothetical protein